MDQVSYICKNKKLENIVYKCLWKAEVMTKKENYV